MPIFKYSKEILLFSLPACLRYMDNSRYINSLYYIDNLRCINSYRYINLIALIAM